MRRRLQRRPAGFNLAFLDIMACGLGAIILIFMMVKYHTVDSDDASDALASELANIRSETAAAEQENRELSAQLESLQEQLQQRLKQSAQSDEAAGEAVDELIKLTKQIAELEKELAQKQAEKKPVTKTRKTKITDRQNARTTSNRFAGTR